MYNQEVLDLIVKEYGVEKSALFCEIAAMMYDIKYNAAKDLQPLSEYDFERTWWNEASVNLTKQISE
jgi:hypothetical protein